MLKATATEEGGKGYGNFALLSSVKNAWGVGLGLFVGFDWKRLLKS